MAYVVTDELYASIDGVPLATPAWVHTNLLELFRPADKRGGEGVTIPGAAGRRAMPAWDDESERLVNLIVANHTDWEGNPHTDLRYGFIRNVQHLKEEIVASPGGDGTRELDLELGGEGTWSGPIVVTGMEYDEDNGAASITVRLPAGQLQLEGS